MIVGGGLYYNKWWEAHKPRPKVLVEVRKVSGNLIAPGDTVVTFDQKTKKTVTHIQPVVLRFTGAIAPLEKLNKVVNNAANEDVTMTPAAEGEWKWTSDRTLTFTPKNDWPASTEYEVRLVTRTLPKEVQLKDNTWKFTTTSLSANFHDTEFYTDLKDPTIHQVTTQLTFNRPIDLKTLEQHLSVAVLGDSPLFAPKGQKPANYFTVEEGANQRLFYVRTARITIPEKEDYLKVILSKDLPTTNGGKGLGEAISTKMRVPDVYSGFGIAGVRSEILRTDEGEPEQFLFVDTKGYVDGPEIEKHVKMWFIPQFEETDDHKMPEAAAAVTDEILKKFKAQPVTLKRVETEKEEGAPMTTAHAFKFLEEKPGWLMVRVSRGVNALGGFKLAGDSSHHVDIPTFPKEVEITSKGGLLALNGERKVALKTRGVPFLRVTLARVPFSQVQHLARFTEGDLQSPYFKGWIDQTNITHMHREIIKIPMHNDYEATYSSFDFSEAVKRADPSDADGSRGMFFLNIEGVQPKKHSKRRMTGDETLEDWKALHKEDALLTQEELNEEPTEEDLKAEEQAAARRDDDDAGDDESVISTRRFILVTDLGLLVKQMPGGAREVFVQSVQQGAPVANTQIWVLAKNGEYVAQGVTSPDGHVSLPSVEHLKQEKKPVAILARLGNDVSFIPFQRPGRLMDFSRFDIGGVLASEKETLDASLFTERGVYRPGDEVHIGAIVRRRDWQGKLEGMPLELKVTDSKDQEVFTEKYPLTEDGYLDMTATTAESDPTGVYVAQLYLVKDEKNRIPLGRTVFRVEDFQPDRMKSELAFNKPDTLAWVKPDDVKATLTVKTLFGFPAADRNIKAKLTLSAAEFSFEQYPDFTFHNRLLEETKKLAGQEVNLGEKKTDDKGEATFELNLERFEGGCFHLNFFAEAFEADGGRSVRAGKSLLVTPFESVIGYKADGSLDFIGKDTERNLKIIGLGPDMKLRAVDGLTYKLIQIRHVSVLTKQESGNYAYVSTKREASIADGAFALGAEGAAYKVPSNTVGDFRLELHDKDNNIVCVVPFTIAGKGDAGRDLERNAELELKLARDSWNSGEELELNYRAPYTGAGLITIERDGIYAVKWFKATTNSGTEHITVPAGLEGTAYVNVSFVRALDSKEVFMSPLSYAVAPFTANPDARRMTVTLDAPKIVKPGEVLKIGYQASKPGRIAIYAVDTGIHQITDYKLPNPLKDFFAKRALEVETEQLLDLILPEFSLLKDAKAFGGDESALKLNLNPFKRRRDPPVVYWSGLVEADTTHREVSYTVPDYFAGQLNIMAVAVAPDSIGAAETKSIVRGPMVLTPNVPVFAAPGDVFTASLTVANNLEGANAPSTIGLSVSGTPNLEFLGGSEQNLEVAPAHEGTVRFQVKVREMLGNAEVTFHAKAGNEAMERRATLSVRPAQPYMTHVQSGYFRLAKQDVKVARDMFPNFRKTNATVSVLPMGLASGLERYLAEYPHGCSEQITSRAMGRLLVASEVDFGYDKAEAVKALDTAFTLLRSRQDSNGGFGYWDARCGDRFDFLSVYVTHFLTEAREADYAVPASLLDGARNRMKQLARLEPGNMDEARLQSAAIYLLTRNGEVTTNQVLNLRDTLDKRFKDKWQSDLTAVYVASTYEMLKQQKEARTLLDAHTAAVKKSAAPASGYYYYQTPQLWRSQEFALMCRHFPDIAGNYGYDDLKPITDPITLGQFNTITAAHSILALKAYSQLAKKSDVKLSIAELPRAEGQQPHLLVPASSGLRSAPFGTDAGGLRFELENGGKADLGAFYQVTEAGFDKGMPQNKVTDGLEVFRELVDAQGKPVTKLRVGDGATLRVQIRNISPQVQYNVAVLDLLPGGFEVEPDALKPGRNTVPGADFTEVREDRNIFYCSLEKGETKTFAYRVKPVAAGTFVIPPVFAESMYDRGINGKSAGGGQVVAEPAQ